MAWSNTGMQTVSEAIRKFTNEFEKSVEGGRICSYYNDDDVPLLTTELLSGGARISGIFHERLAFDIVKMEIDEKDLRREIAYTIRNTRGIRGDLFTSYVAFEAIVKKRIARLSDPAMKCIDLVETELVNVVRLCAEHISRYPRLMRELERITTDHITANECKKHVSLMIKSQLAYINTSHEDFVGFANKDSDEASAAAAAQKQSGNHVFRKGWLSITGSREAFFVLSSQNLSWYKDEEENENQHVLLLDGLKLREVGTHKFALFAPDGTNLYEGRDLLEISAQTRDDANSWKASFLRAGVYPEKETSSRADVEGEERQVAGSLDPQLERHVETVKRLVDSYMHIVTKTVRDMVPKYITLLMIHRTRDFMKNELLARINQIGDQDQLMEESEEATRRRVDLQRMHRAAGEDFNRSIVSTELPSSPTAPVVQPHIPEDQSVVLPSPRASPNRLPHPLVPECPPPQPQTKETTGQAPGTAEDQLIFFSDDHHDQAASTDVRSEVELFLPQVEESPKPEEREAVEKSSAAAAAPSAGTTDTAAPVCTITTSDSPQPAAATYNTSEAVADVVEISLSPAEPESATLAAPDSRPGADSAALPTAAAAISNMSYAEFIVAKGNGNQDDCCQKSVDLTISRSTPVECILSHVEHPSFFWIQLSNTIIEQIDDEMMQELESRMSVLSEPKAGDYCAAPVEEDPELMRRAKILEVKENALGTQFAKILYIDTGKIEWVSTNALLQIPARVRHFPRQACPCILADVEPATGVWDESITAAFRKLCATDETTNLFVQALDEGGAPTINTVSLYRVKNRDMKASKETVLIPLIREMAGKVRRAERQVPMISFEKEGSDTVIGGSHPPDVTDGWRCVVRVMENVQEEAAAESAQEAQQPQEPRPERRRLPDLVQGFVRSASLVEAMDPDGMLYFHITEVVSPSEFYVQVRSKDGRNAALDRLTVDMNSFYSNPINQMILTHTSTEAQFAVVRFPIDGTTAFRRIMVRDWYTPGGTGTTDYRVNSIVTATFVDDGIGRRLKTKDLFVLDQRFCYLRAQATFCKLNDCMPNSASGTWDRNAIDIFRALTMQGRPLLKALVVTEKEPFELIVMRTEDDGTDTFITTKMVQANCARSDIDFST